MGSKISSSSESMLSGKEDERGVNGGSEVVDGAGGGLVGWLEAMVTDSQFWMHKKKLPGDGYICRRE